MYNSFSHDLVDCRKRCTRSLKCGHPCTQLCYDACKSDCECNPVDERNEATKVTSLSPKKNTLQAKEIPNASPSKKQQPPTSSRSHRAPSPEKHDQPGLQLQQRTSAHFIDLTDVIADTAHASPSATPTPAPALRNPEQQIKAFQDYAAGGHIESDKNIAAIAEQENAEAVLKRLDAENFAALFSDVNIAKKDGALTEKLDNVNLVRVKTDGQVGSRGIWKGTFEVPRKDEDTGTSEEGASLLDLL